jgi:hypothetical protein
VFPNKWISCYSIKLTEQIIKSITQHTMSMDRQRRITKTVLLATTSLWDETKRHVHSLASLLRVRDFQSPETELPESDLSWLGKPWYSGTINTTFRIFFNSLFICHHIIRRHMTYEAETMLLNKLKIKQVKPTFELTSWKWRWSAIQCTECSNQWHSSSDITDLMSTLSLLYTTCNS